MTGAELLVAPITPEGEVDKDALLALLSDDVRLLAMSHVSNALGTVNPVAEVIAAARLFGMFSLPWGLLPPT